MKFRLLLAAVFALTVSGLSYAEETAQAPEAMEMAKVEAGNKICPISGHGVSDMGEPHKVEYKGKTYNLCCKMCEKDFLKDPEATILKIEEMEKTAAVSGDAMEKSDMAPEAMEGMHDEMKAEMKGMHEDMMEKK